MIHSVYYLSLIINQYCEAMKIATLCFFFLCLAASQEPEEIIYEEPTLDPLPTPPPEVILEAPQPEPVESTPPPKPREPFRLDMKTLKTYQNEVLVIGLVFFYLMMYVRGKGNNVKLMERFYRKVSGCL